MVAALMAPLVCAAQESERNTSDSALEAQVKRLDEEVRGDDNPPGDRTSRSKKDRQKATESELDEQAILKFVGDHQSKLLDLMTYLKPQQEQYQRALREVNRSMQRLQSLESRDAEMYQIELELWRIRSQQQLVAAEVLAAKDDTAKEAAQQRLKTLIEKEAKKILDRLKLQQDRAQRQVEKLSAQIEERILREDDFVNKSFATWQNRLARQAKNQENRTRRVKQSNAKRKRSAERPTADKNKSGK